MQKNNYRKFALIMTISFISMYAVMFLNVSETDHIYISTTRFYMSLLMVCPMAVLMIGMMGGMYPIKKLNGLISAIAIVVFITAFYLLRTQTFISDKQYMRAMIPHHSSAIMTSEHATIKDPEVRKLADAIIASQKREIAEMKEILARMNK